MSDETKSMTHIVRMENVLRSVLVKIEEMDKKLDELLYEDTISNVEEVTSNVNDFISEDTIRNQGQKIPYNKLAGADQIARFRSFLSYVRMHEDKFTEKEFEFAAFADKNFSDIRISDNSRRILGAAFQKAYGKPWEFQWIRGYMHKYQNQMAWSWQDGSTD